MADEILSAGDRRILPELWHDNGDGSYSRVIYSQNGGGGGGGAADREIVVNNFRVTTAFTGASVGDVITQMRVLDLTGDDPVQVGATIWFNDTTQLALASAPSAANLEPLGAAGLTNSQLVAALSTQTTSINGTVLTNAQHVAALATQTTAITGALGATNSAPAADPTVTTGLSGVLRGLWKFFTDSAGSAVDALQLTGSYQTNRAVMYLYNTSTTFLSRIRGNDNGVFVQGNVASAAADAGNPVKAGGVYNQTAVNYTSGNRADLQVDSRGQLLVNTLFSSTLPADATGNGLVQMQRDKLNTANIIPTAAGFYYNGSTWDRVRGDTNGSFVQGNLATATADAGNPVKIGAVYQPVVANLASGQRGQLSMSLKSALMVTLGGNSNPGDNVSNLNVIMQYSQGGSDVIPACANMIFDAANGWQRQRGDVTGTAVNTLKRPLVARLLAVTAASATIQLTAAVKRVSIYARGGDMFYRLSTATSTAVVTDHFIAQGERLDLDVDNGTPWLSAIRAGSTDGTLQITELS